MFRILLLLVLINISCTPESQRSDDELQKNQTEEIQQSQSSDSDFENQVSADVNGTTLLSTIAKLLGYLYIILIHVGLVIVFIKYKNRQDLINSLNRTISENKREVESINDSKNKLTRDLDLLTNKNEYLTDMIEDLSGKINQPTIERERIDREPIDGSSVPEEIINENKGKSLENIINDNPNRKTLYYSTPSKNGSFDFEKGVESPKGRRMYYEITFREGKDFGEIKYRTGRLDESALEQKDSILKPVCYINNSEISNPTSIRVLDRGQVKLKGDKWVIKEKIHLEFNR